MKSGTCPPGTCSVLNTSTFAAWHLFGPQNFNCQPLGRVQICFMSVGPYRPGGVLSRFEGGSPKSFLGKTRTYTKSYQWDSTSIQLQDRPCHIKVKLVQASNEYIAIKRKYVVGGGEFLSGDDFSGGLSENWLNTRSTSAAPWFSLINLFPIFCCQIACSFSLE